MAATAVQPSASQNAAATKSQQGSAVDSLANALANVEIQEDEHSEEKVEQSPRELHIYSNPQLLLLSKSPLVKAPDGMPPLKDWFGDWSEQQSGNKKEAESSSGTTNGRERRFRRDAEDGDTPSRPSFRSSLSQPSQMGNFRHQSLRTADRERDRDSERERQRDERDRENQERLRNLSDKYDRERLALSSASALRGKERESAPHLTSTTGRNGQGQSTTSSRRADGREPAKKKPGEASDDWRRGAEPPARGSRDDRSETTRRDRDRRESSRTRRDPSTSRRDRDRSRRRDERDDPRRDKDDYFRRDADDRDDGYRDRDRYDYGRSQRDLDRDLDEDPRRWRDDGKRDERVATRKERERAERDRERGWDRWEPSHDRDRDRLDDRDTRSKRASGRDRRSGAGLDDTKDKEERKEREKEKEPAWMETYVPTTPGGGILGGQSADGELDGIQAWKKGLKEKEKKEKEAEQTADAAPKVTSTSAESATSHPPPPAAEGPLDEIQLFKLMMKRDAARKDSDPSPVLPSPGLLSTDRHSPAKLREASAPTPGASSSAASPAPLSTEASAASNAPSSAAEGSKLLSFLAQTSTDAASSQVPKLPTPNIPAPDNFPPAVSRMFPTPPGLSPAISQNSERPVVDLSTPSYPNTPFDPPAGSRLLAFASRAAPGASQVPLKNLSPSEASGLPFNPHAPSALPGGPGQRLTGLNPPPGMPINAGMQQAHDMMFDAQVEPHMIPNPRATPSERSARSFSPFGQPHQSPFGLHDAPEGIRLSQADAMRRVSGHGERGLGLGPDNSPGFVDLGGAPGGFNGGSYELGGNAIGAGTSAAKGSRFAKFFDAKNREPQINVGRKASGGAGFVSTSPLPGQGRDPMTMNGMSNTPVESRAMEDLFAMLQNSTQHHRASPGLNQTGRLSAAGGPFGQAPIDLQVLQQQQQLQQLHHQQQLAQQNARLDSLYDSRMDDRNFVPDGMVPGLRLAPRPRSREPAMMHFNDHLDEPLQVNPRLAQQQRNLEQLYAGGPAPNAFGQQGGLGRNVPALQQNQFRGNPSMVQAPNVPQGPQRLPPGLANLGGRPPHDASQFLNTQLNNLAPPHGGPHVSQQQSLNNFGGLGGFNGPVPGRGGPIGGPHHNAPLPVNQLGGMGPGNGMDLRAQHTQAQLLNLGAGGMGVGNGMGGGVRGAGGYHGQPTSVAQMQAQQLARQQQQQQQLQHIGMPPAHLLPPHLQPQQQQQNIHTNSQGAQDLMALLMGGQRE